MTAEDLLHEAIPMLTRVWQSVPDNRRQEVAALVFAPELADERSPDEPTAFLLPRDIIRAGLSMACQHGGNTKPLEAFDANVTGIDQLVIVVFAPGVIATYILRRGAQVVLDLN